MSSKLCLFMALVLISIGYSQAQIKVQETVANAVITLPDANAILELESNNKGLLFSRVPLVGLTNPSPLSAHVLGMMVFNTTNSNQLTPGIYYNDGSKWIAVGGKTAASNIEYDPSTYFISFMNVDGSKVTVDLPDVIQKKQTLTTLKFSVIEEEGENPGSILQIATLNYFDEKGDKTSIDLRGLVKSGETLTSLSYDGDLHQLIYTDEDSVANVFDLVDLIGDVETLTSLSLDVDNKLLRYSDEVKRVTELDLAPLIQEPWYSRETNTGATLNTEDVYSMGWVGIGVKEKSAAINEKLRVNGAISTVNSYYADYVFEDYFKGSSSIKFDYKFKSLYEVEEYVKAHHHLPGITPIHELVKTEDGYLYNVSELSIQLLEKTEELYLHAIEQHHTVQAQRQLLDQQKEKIRRLEEAEIALKIRLERLEKMLLQQIKK